MLDTLGGEYFSLFVPFKFITIHSESTAGNQAGLPAGQRAVSKSVERLKHRGWASVIACLMFWCYSDPFSGTRYCGFPTILTG